MCGIAGTKEDYGSYTQDNIGANMKTDDFLKCHFNNKWDISKQGRAVQHVGRPAQTAQMYNQQCLRYKSEYQPSAITETFPCGWKKPQ